MSVPLPEVVVPMTVPFNVPAEAPAASVRVRFSVAPVIDPVTVRSPQVPVTVAPLSLSTTRANCGSAVGVVTTWAM